MRILDLLLPPACAGCGRPGAAWCGDCRRRVRPAGEGSGRFLVPDAGVVIGERLLLAVAAFAHEGPMRRALAALKYTGASSLATPLADLAAPVLDPLLAVAGRATLVPVPVHAERKAERGYNQAALIAERLSRRCGLPVADALRRVHPTTRQHRLDRAARLRNLRGAFAIDRRPPPVVILVDDIITTTATLEACATVLADAGCEQVYGFAIAREV